MKLTKRINEGARIPAWYGVAWRDWMHNDAVCLPIPFNVVARWGREVVIWLKHGHIPVHQSPRDAFMQGIEVGRREVRLPEHRLTGR